MTQKKEDSKQIALNWMSIQLDDLQNTVNLVDKLIEGGKVNSKLMNAVLGLRVGSNRIANTFFEIPEVKRS